MNILKQFISERIPQTATNIFFQMFNGIQAMFDTLEYRLDIFKRERNILTAQNLSSLRSLAAQNGFEPQLRQSAKGVLMVKISPKLFNRVGYPLFIKPYSVFTNKFTKLDYYYISDKTLRIDSNTYYIPVVEGIIETKSFDIKQTGSQRYIQRFYLQDDRVAEDSIIVEVAGYQFKKVKSFYDNEGINENKQFQTKFSNDAQNPIVIYIKGLEQNDTVNITYRLSNGELGNLAQQMEFETESIVDSYGSMINPADDEIQIVNISGFQFGSNGTDENSLRAAIGFNHGINLLFDNISYRTFLGKFSTILVQDIKVNKETKQINNIYLWKKNSLNPTNNSKDIIKQYKQIIEQEMYIVPEEEKLELNKLLTENEYCLSSHTLLNAKLCKYAIQIIFDTTEELDTHKDTIEQLLYFEFGKFLYIRNHMINMETLLTEFQKANNVNIEYILFNEHIEKNKLTNKKEFDTPYIISHTDKTDLKNYFENQDGPYLPILNGSFDIADSDFNRYELFFDINFVSKH